ncbi:MAG: DNA methyltransferase [Aestuariivirga sp.]|uniref:class I SAM-dependent DNA methyltransferase n=1 Tax=Aestuariivirga sp. TaxID=2650926 RepID=UPI00301AB0D0
MTADAISKFITHWRNAGGGERAQSQKFLIHFCQALGLEEPMDGDYKFEFDVKGDRGRNFIDLYKRGAFVLESKQSRARRERSEFPNQKDLFPKENDQQRGKSSRAWDVLMNNARQQAENYARHLPPAHDWPPFIIVCDVGLCFELYADFTGKGRNYTQFPDRQNFRIYLDDLAKPEIQQLFRLIWDDPHALDPTRRAVKATRQIAERLAAVSKRMEQRKLPAEDVAAFLMRCIFTMFAEDVELLPKDTFTSLLDRARDKPHIFAPELEMLWQAMDRGDYASAVQDRVKKFNGQLFRDAPAYPLEKEEIGELREAARQDWREVDPSIFGTLLEQALDPDVRARLGAHYTPRAYVERLVVATVIEPLRSEWQQVLTAAERLTGEGRSKDAIAAVQAFHEKLYNTHVLDPACGTGNFLYVTLELMKRLEGDVVEALLNLGGQQALAGLERHEVDPHQFLGLEINARARHIAELVLWIGYLQWHIRNNRSLPGEPVLRDYRNIRHMDAVLAQDGVDAKGHYINPRRPEWPEADYIVGNPPFIGGKDIRSKLGDDYAEALWAAHKDMNDSADFVMYWWDRAAEVLTRKATRLKRFGLVTTNSITQVFQRRTVEKHLSAKQPVSILLAIPDHPWTKATKQAAAVRIAMTAVGAGRLDGVLQEVVSEEGLDTDEPKLAFRRSEGKINNDLTIGADLSTVSPLVSNSGLSSRGMMLFGAGFIVTEQEAQHLGLGRRAGLERYIRPYRNGRDIVSTPRGVMAIDLYGLDSERVRDEYPEVYQHLLRSVKPKRDQNRDADIKARWWLFGRTRDEIRPALVGLPRYIATVETAKHRIFQFLNAAILPDNKIVVIAFDDSFMLGILMSRIHFTWYAANSAKIGVYEGDAVYVKSRCFDPFPFPDPDEFTRSRIASIAEKLDAHRKAVQADHPEITLTQMYNVLEKLRSGAALSKEDERLRDDGLVLILKELHAELDAAVAQAYGWPVDLPEQEVLVRLVALNKQRAGEEAKGQVRWLRPDYQIPRFGSAREKQEQFEADLGLPAAAAAKAKVNFPAGAVEQAGAVMAALAAAATPLSALDIALSFKQGRKAEPQVRATLAAMARMGFIAIHDAGTRFALRRAA